MQQQLSQMTTQIPDDITRLAHEQQLGAPQENYTITQLRRGWRWTQFVFLFGVLLLIITFASLFINIALDSFSFTGTFFLPSIILSYALCIVGGLAWSFTHKFCAIYTCDRGLILRQSMVKFHVIRWSEIETIWQAIRVYPGLFSRGRLYTIHCHDGYTLTFSGFRKGLANLEKTLEEQFTRRRLPFLFADYQAGQALRFGPLSIDRNGITAQDKMLPWEQVADVSRVKDQHLVVYKVDEPPETWLKLPAFKIPTSVSC